MSFVFEVKVAQINEVKFDFVEQGCIVIKTECESGFGEFRLYDFGEDFRKTMRKLMEITQVGEYFDLNNFKNKIIRIDAKGGSIRRIGHPYKDLWLGFPVE